MRILFIGEYSRLHNSLKEALEISGHQAYIAGNGDGFKNFPVDFSTDARFCKAKPLNWIRQAIFRVFKYDIAEIEHGIRFYFLLPKLKGFDVVQLISETPILTWLPLELVLLKRLKSQNKKMFILSSGTDVAFMKAIAEKRFRYSLLDPYLKDKSRISEYRHVLCQYNAPYIDHHNNIYKIAQGVIATDVDYAISLEGEPKFLGMIPNPVNLSKLDYDLPYPDGKIVIFHGINRWNYFKKGSDFFEKALAEINKKYQDKIEIIQTDTLPYDEYIKRYNSAHIVLDQVFAYDQGYNALEAMARGKVVFTGAEREFYDYYNLNETVAVNALPDVDYLVGKLSDLIENPSKIIEISKNARAFVEREHDYLKIADKYLELWARE